MQGKEAMDKLFLKLGPRFHNSNRAGGYTRVLKAGLSPISKGPMAVIEYLDNGLVPLRQPRSAIPDKKSAKNAAPAAAAAAASAGVDSISTRLAQTTL